MLYCANCKASYPEGKKFCRTCGGGLVEVAEAPPAPRSAAAQKCPSCGGEVPPGKMFCRACGASLEGAEPERAAVTPRFTPSTTTAPITPVFRAGAAAPARSRTPIIAGAIVLVVAVGAVAAYFATRKDVSTVNVPAGVLPAPVGAEQAGTGASASGAATAIVSMARQGNLVTPPGGSAYDSFLRLKQQGLAGGDVSMLKAQVLPLLTEWSNREFQRWHDESNLTGEDWQNLQKVCAWAAELEPSSSEIQARRVYSEAQLEFLGRNYSSAIEHFNEAARLAPNWAMPINALARIAVVNGRPSDAEDLYKRAIDLEPNWVYPNMNLASHYVRTKRYDLALPYGERATQLAPDKPMPHYRLAYIYEQLGRLPEARQQLQSVLETQERNPSPEVNPDQVRAELAALDAKLSR